jgi:cation transport regulator ChaC
MPIACLGWGSLIWQPESLPVKPSDWFPDGPALPLEFARQSSRDRITLVIVKNGPSMPVCWCYLPFETMTDAISALRKREGTMRIPD